MRSNTDLSGHPHEKIPIVIGFNKQYLDQDGAVSEKPTDSAEWLAFTHSLGLSLRRARKKKRLTQGEAAAIAGISLYNYQQHERGRVL